MMETIGQKGTNLLQIRKRRERWQKIENCVSSHSEAFIYLFIYLREIA